MILERRRVYNILILARYEFEIRRWVRKFLQWFNVKLDVLVVLLILHSGTNFVLNVKYFWPLLACCSVIVAEFTVCIREEQCTVMTFVGWKCANDKNPSHTSSTIWKQSFSMAVCVRSCNHFHKWSLRCHWWRTIRMRMNGRHGATHWLSPCHNSG